MHAHSRVGVLLSRRIALPVTAQCVACGAQLAQLPRRALRLGFKRRRLSAGASGNGSSPGGEQIERLDGSSCRLYPTDSESEDEEGNASDAELSRSNSRGEASWKNLRDNASKAFQHEEDMGSEDARSLRSSTVSKPKIRRGLRLYKREFDHFIARVAYQYYNWRKDSWQDVQLFVGINLVLLVLGGLAKGIIVDALDGVLGETGISHFWTDVYEVLVVVFGQELPDATASVIDQAFSLVVAFIGLGAFALVLALIEQVVLENLETNVRTGSLVFEKDHVLVLGVCDNQRDEEVMWKILSQICLGYRNDGGRTVVVLSRRSKLEMENTFRRIIPDDQRFGSRFVFRSGTPLVPADLRLVAASEAAAIVVVADTSRSPEEADAQSLRTAVLLDELDFPGFGVPDPRKAHILVELRTPNAVKLMQYSTSQRVIAVPTAQLNARRISRMVQNPVVGSIGQMLLSFNSASQTYVETFPELEGKAFGELFKWFPDGIVFGLVNQYSAKVKINPPPSTFIASGDSLLIARPNGVTGNRYSHSKTPADVKIGDWVSGEYVRSSHDELPMGRDSTFSRATAMTGKANWQGEKRGSQLEGGMQAGMFMLPLEYSSSSATPEKVLICGWGDLSFMAMLLRELDRGPAALPRGSELTLFNSREGLLGTIRDKAALESLSVLHIQGNPLDMEDMRAKLDISRYKCVIVLCDQMWLDPDLDARNGILMEGSNDMLRLDSMIMMVQLGIRQLMEVLADDLRLTSQAADFPEINIICEKVAFEGVTRFEDRYRLPLGVSVNMSAFSATFLAQAAYDPRILLPYSHFGEGHELTVQDSSAFAVEGEELSFWQLQMIEQIGNLQARASSVGQVMYGTYKIPASADQPIDIVINPIGDDIRSVKRVWNQGDSMRKVITMAPKPQRDPHLDGKSILTSPGVQSPAPSEEAKVAGTASE